MNIGEAASRASLPVKTVRYYEEIDLVTPDRSENGYRTYSGDDVKRLRFLQRSRRLGFSLDECRALLSLYQDTHRASSDVKAIAGAKIAEIDSRIADLQDLRRHLSDLAADCHGDDLPFCPIIEDLAAE